MNHHQNFLNDLALVTNEIEMWDMYSVYTFLLSFSYILKITTCSIFFKVLNSWNGKWNEIVGSKEKIKHLKTENREPKENQHLKPDKRISKRRRSELCSVICLLRNKYFIMQRLRTSFVPIVKVCFNFLQIPGEQVYFLGKTQGKIGRELVRSFNNHSQI